MPDLTAPTDLIPFTPAQQQQWNQIQPSSDASPSATPDTSPDVIPYSSDQLRQKMAADPWFPLTQDQARVLWDEDQKESLGDKTGKLWSGAKRGAAGIKDTFVQAHNELKDEPMSGQNLGRLGATLSEGIARGATFWKNLCLETLRNMGNAMVDNGDPDVSVPLYHQKLLAEQAHQRQMRSLPDQRPDDYDPAKPSYILPQTFGYEPFDKAASAVSLFLPPAPPVAAGAKNLVTPLTEGAVRTGELAGKVQAGAAKAAGALEQAGRAVKNLAGLPEEKLAELTERFVPEEAKATAESLTHMVGGGAAIAGVAGHGGPAGVAAAALKAGQLGGSAAEQTGAFLRYLTSTYGDSAKTRLLQIAANTEAPKWIRTLAGGLHDLGVGTAAKAATDLGESALHGAATGAAMGALSGKDAEGIGEFAGGGALLGASGRVLSKALGGDARVEAARRALASKQRLWNYLERAGVPNETRARIDDFTASVAGTALDLFGNDVDIQFLEPAQSQPLAKQYGQAGASAWFGKDQKSGRNTIFVTAGDRSGRLLHELPHAVARAAGADEPTRLMIDSLFSPQELAVMRREYAQKMVDAELRDPDSARSVSNPDHYRQLIDEKVKQLDQQAGGNQWIYDEIYAEAGFNGLLNRSLDKIANGDPLWGRLQNKARGAFWHAMGMEVDPETGEPLVPVNPRAALFSNPDVYSNPELRRLFYENLRQWNRYGAKEAALGKETKEGVPVGTGVSLDLYGQHPAVPMEPNPTTGRLENDAAVKDPKTGEVTLRKPSEVRRIEKTRQEATRKAFEKEPVKPVTDTTPEVSPRQDAEGKVETTGSKITDQLLKMPWIGEEARKNARVYEGEMGTGNVIEAWYQAIGHGWKWYQDVRRRLGNIAAAKLKLAPFLFKVSKEGNVLVVGLSVTAAQRKMAKWANTGKLNGEWGGDVGLFQKDLMTYLQNHANGVDGGTGLNPNKKNLLNAFVLGDNRTFHHLNPLRDTLKGEDKQGIIRSLRLDRIASAEKAPDKGWFPRYERLKYNQSPEAVATEAIPEHLDKDEIEAVRSFPGAVAVGTPEASPVAVSNELGLATPRFSARTWEATDKEQLLKELVAKGFDEKLAAKWIADVNNVAATIIRNREALDYDGAPEFKAIKNNADPYYTLSEDYSTLCRKSMKFLATVGATMISLGRGMTPSEMWAVRNMMRESGDIVPCAACYVNSRKIKVGKSLDDIAARFPNVPREILFDPGRADVLARDYPEAWAMLMSKGSGVGKAFEVRTEYRRDVLEHATAGFVRRQNMFSGLRAQSWSDFEILHVIDKMQSALDKALVGLMSHSYTKVPQYVELVAPTGEMTNMSLVPLGTGLDEHGHLVFDDREGMPFAEAMRLREQFDKTAGTILIGANDEHIIAAMADPRIDYIIPYHASGLAKEQMQHSELRGWRDYEQASHRWKREGGVNEGQHEEVGDEKKFAHYKAWKKEQGLLANQNEIRPWEYWDPSLDGDANAQRYLDYCQKVGVVPKFQHLSERPGYWKLLVDRRMYDKTGKYIQQQVVTPNFDMQTVNRLFNEHLSKVWEGVGDSSPNEQVVLKAVQAFKDNQVDPVTLMGGPKAVAGTKEAGSP